MRTIIARAVGAEGQYIHATLVVGPGQPCDLDDAIAEMFRQAFGEEAQEVTTHVFPYIEEEDGLIDE